MIELVRSQLDERDQTRWAATLAEPPLLRQSAWWIAPEVPTFVATLWLIPYAVTFVTSAALPPPGVVLAIRALAAAAWVISARLCARSWRAREAVWPTGRYLFPWGYAEVEGDVLRLIPMADLEHEIRGRALGVGSIRLHLRSGAWSTWFGLRAGEVEAVSTAFEDAVSIPVAIHTGGYRDAVATLKNEGVERRPLGRARELGWAVIAAIVGAAVPPTPIALDTSHETVPITRADLDVRMQRDARAAEDARRANEVSGNEEGFRPVYVAALRTRDWDTRHPRVPLELGQCSNQPVVMESVASYLTLALTTPRLGPANPFLPVLGPAVRGWARVWANCSWEVDQTNGTFLRARARWGLDRDGETILERQATVESGDVIRLVDECTAPDRSGRFSPEGLAIASLLLLEGAIRTDVYEDPGPLTDGDLWPTSSSCIAHAVGRIAVRPVGNLIP